MIEPIVPPIAANMPNCARTAGGNPTAAKDVRKPEPTPSMPRTLPCLAVDWEASPVRDPGEGYLRMWLSKTRKAAHTDAKNTARQISSLNETSKAGLGGEQESTGEHRSRDRIQPVVLRWVSRAYRLRPWVNLDKKADGKPTLEHIQHPLGNNEPSSDIDARQQDRECSKGLRNRSREVSATHDEQSANTDHTRDRIRDRHKRRVELQEQLFSNTVCRWRGETLTAGLTPQTTR